MEHFGEQFLHSKDSKLHTSEPVEFEQKQKERRQEPKSQKPADKIADWLKVIEKTHLRHRDPNDLEYFDILVPERIKSYYHKQYVIKRADIPYSTYALEQRIAQQLGHGKIEINEEFMQKKAEQIISDQKHSLDRWVDYLTSPDADYPMWAKYWAFTSMVKMGKLEKKTDEVEKDGQIVETEVARFANRDKSTVAPFPPMNPNALAKTFSAIEAKAKENTKQKNERTTVPNQSTKLSDEDFQKLLNAENFSKLYTQFLIEIPEYSAEGLRETRGIWKKYEQGSEPDELANSLDGYPLEWCTANKDTARTQLQGGDFYVYYSINDQNEPVIPRVAIRMEGGSIAEVRGIAPDQNLDPYISDVVEKKMAEFPDGEQYKKKSSDMKRMTEIHEKFALNRELTKEDLKFLYEIDSKIEGFGYHKDPRIQEIISTRDLKADTAILHDCTIDQIAQKPEEFHDGTKVYIGIIPPSLFKRIISQVDKYYYEFPGNKKGKELEIISQYPLEQIASVPEEITENTKVYVGELVDNIFKKLPDSIEHICNLNYFNEIVKIKKISGLKTTTLREETKNLKINQMEITPSANEILTKKEVENSTIDEEVIIEISSYYLLKNNTNSEKLEDVFNGALNLGLELGTLKTMIKYFAITVNEKRGENINDLYLGTEPVLVKEKPDNIVDIGDSLISFSEEGEIIEPEKYKTIDGSLVLLHCHLSSLSSPTLATKRITPESKFAGNFVFRKARQIDKI